jgi:hypothetical protein
MINLTEDIGPYDVAWHLPFVGLLAQHSVFLRPIIDVVMLNNDIKAIYEIGTADGALAVYLGLWGLFKDIPVTTFDIEELPDIVKAFLLKLRVMPYQMDVFTDEVKEMITVRDEPCYLICDGGDKPKEIQVYSELLPAGSVISAHDWGQEIGEEDVKGLPLKPWIEDSWLWNNAQFATWRVV